MSNWILPLNTINHIRGVTRHNLQQFFIDSISGKKLFTFQLPTDANLLLLTVASLNWPRYVLIYNDSALPDLTKIAKSSHINSNDIWAQIVERFLKFSNGIHIETLDCLGIVWQKGDFRHIVIKGTIPNVKYSYFEIHLKEKSIRMTYLRNFFVRLLPRFR